MRDIFRKRFIVSLFLFLCAFICRAESFRTHKMSVISFEEENQSEQTVRIGINDSIGVRLPEDLTFIEGIEVKVMIPAAVSEWRDSVAFALYDNVSPLPSDSIIDYSGRRIYVKPLPSRMSWIAQIPLRAENSLKDSQYAVKTDVIPTVSSRFVFMRFLPVMKGVPEETLSAVLNVSVKPILIDKGRLVLSVNTPSKEAAPFVLLVDDKTVALSSDNSVLLSSGEHNICIQPDGYRNEVFSVYIDRARTAVYEVTLKSLSPTLSLSAPDTVEIFFDDRKVMSADGEFEISEGEHRLRFLMGSYELIRQLHAEKGKSYSVNLSVDLQITEE